MELIERLQKFAVAAVFQIGLSGVGNQTKLFHGSSSE